MSHDGRHIIGNQIGMYFDVCARVIRNINVINTLDLDM